MTTPEDALPLEALREILTAPEEAWEAMLAHLLDETPEAVVARIPPFLTGRLEAASSAHAMRMRGIIAAIQVAQDLHALTVAAGEMPPPGPTPAQGDVASIAAELNALRDQKRDLDARIRALSQALVERLGGPGKQEIAGWSVSVTRPRLSVKVSDLDALPVAFQSPAPDRKKILAHYKETGEVLPGVEISHGRSSVSVSALDDPLA